MDRCIARDREEGVRIPILLSLARSLSLSHTHTHLLSHLPSSVRLQSCVRACARNSVCTRSVVRFFQSYVRCSLSLALTERECMVSLRENAWSH